MKKEKRRCFFSLLRCPYITKTAKLNQLLHQDVGNVLPIKEEIIGKIYVNYWRKTDSNKPFIADDSVNFHIRRQ